MVVQYAVNFCCILIISVHLTTKAYSYNLDVRKQKEKESAG